MTRNTVQKNSSVYDAYKRDGVPMTETELYRTVRFSLDGQSYTVYVTKRKATKASRIYCEADGTVYWEQMHAVGHISCYGEKSPVIKPPRGTGEIVIVVIKGHPSVICGLDENGFVSAGGMRRRDTDVYVMSEMAFRQLSPATGKV